jgi:hypothetical protein
MKLKIAATISCLFALMVASVLPMAPAHAQPTLTWVSGVGNDDNPCTRTAPCLTFQGAFGKTATGGEIECLDPGSFGEVLITKSITIFCTPSSNGGVQAFDGGTGITVNLPTATGRVVLDGLDLEGLGSAQYGVTMKGLGQLIIRNSSIRDFEFGVLMEGEYGSPATRIVIQNCLITNNPGSGIYQNGYGAPNNGEVLNTLIDSNGSGPGIWVTGPGTIVLAGSTITGQSTAISVTNGGQVISYGNNVIRNTGTPTSTEPLQ